VAIEIIYYLENKTNPFENPHRKIQLRRLLDREKRQSLPIKPKEKYKLHLLIVENLQKFLDSQL
jgi:hypothetical protein